MQQHLTRILTSSILIVFTLLVGLFFQVETKHLDQALSKTEQIYSDQTANLAENINISPSIWLNTNPTQLDISFKPDQQNTPIQFHLIESKQSSSHEIACSSEHVIPSIKIQTDVSATSLSFDYLSDLLSLAVDKQYSVSLQSPLEEVDEYALVSYPEGYSDGMFPSEVDCGEQTLSTPTTLVTHISTLSSKDNIQIQ